MIQRVLLALIGPALLQTTMLFAQPVGRTVLTGTVRNASGAAVAGATVTASSESLIGGPRAAVSDAAGRYRFASLPPGTYRLTVGLNGFRPAEGHARLRAGEIVTFDTNLQAGGSTEAPTTSSDAVGVDRSSTGSTHVTAEFLADTPVAERFGPGPLLLAPGVNPENYYAFGSPPWSNAYRLDDLNIGDPEGGRAWVFPALNWIADMRVVRHGAGAEHGGSSGLASETLLRSGTNSFHGLLESLYRNAALTGANVSDEVLAANEDLSPGHTDLVTDSSVQIGGPLQRDTLWFFAGGHFYYARQAPGGYPAATPPGITEGSAVRSPSESSPRVLFKPTWRWSDRSTLSGFVHSERNVLEARGAASRVAPEATLAEHSSTTAWNGHLTRILSPATVVDATYSGFRGTDNLVPYNGATPGWYDVAADFYFSNSYYRYDAGRNRQQAHAAMSTARGAHDLEFGGGFDLGSATTAYGYPGGRSVDAASGVPFFVYLWDGSNKDDVSSTYAAYAQDAWRVRSAVTVNAGARFERTGGKNRHADASVYSTTSIAPRLGLAWDIGRGGASVLRAHYGWYFPAALSADYDAVDPNISPLYGADVDRRLNLTSPLSVLQPGTNHTVARDLRTPRTREAAVGLDHTLFKHIVAGVYGIERRSDRFVDDVLQSGAGDFVKTTVKDVGPDGFAGSGDETTNTADLYSQSTNVLRNQFLITNLPGSFRTYRGLEITVRKPATGRWGLEGSWVFSRTTGNYDASEPAASADFETPNTDPAVQPLRTGNVANDTTHIAKAFGTYRLPLRVMLSGAFYYTSGGTFTRTQGISLNQGRVDLFMEPRGSGRYGAVMRLDARAQRQFSIAGRRLGVEVDGFNLMNDAAVTSRVTQSGLRYFVPLAIVEARRFRVGVVYRF